MNAAASSFQNPRARLWIAAGLFALLLAARWVLPTFYITLFNYIGLYALVALGLMLLTGVAGLTSFGQAAFMGLGAYATAILTTQLGWSPWLTLLVSLGGAGLVALVLGFITLRMQGHYLPLATIAWGISLYYIFGNATGLTGGFTGITSVPALPLPFGMQLSNERDFYLLIFAVVILAFVGVQNLLSSRVGRTVRALRGGSVVAESFGANTAQLKIQVFLYAALLASLSGWLYAHLQRFVNPTPFGLNAGIEFLFMAVVGGAGSVWGALLGAGIITVLKDWLQDLLPRLLGQNGSFEIIVFGILVVILLQTSRQGLWPLLDRFVPPAPRPRPKAAAPLPTKLRPKTGEVLLEVRSASRRFGGLLAVSELSFTLRAGEILGLIGPNGAGKSTMFNLISGVLPPSGGEILLGGQRIDHLGARRIARLGVARTFQHVKLFPEMTLLENAAMGAYLRAGAGMAASSLHLPAERAEEARILFEAQTQLDRVGLGDLAQTQAGNLPLGKQRILEIARALCADPSLLLLDEPAAGLRHLEKQELAALLRRLRAEGVTVLLVEHDMDLVMSLADRLVVMNYGQKLAEGTPREIQQNEKVLEAYLGGVA
ncbi:branched-chain amino acid transport system permease protein [Deinobacterium chartae]|uniref:Branched-chain amino acid transport system permease protein n=1 Tax=Deinobacterium chartae TaxID=521158 RepID=A0A841I1U8_9DEIO|nr:branched-chain amino acid ABC transporter ATP-binding protein/permease [Deinobacterium chartae]MBB6099036.1 branched-chain amino acid transport system permease protein [Deinobacterium chartae]